MTYNGPLGLPFVFEDKTGSMSNTILSDIYGRLTIRFDESLQRPGRSVVMIRVAGSSSSATQTALVPEAVLDLDTSQKALLGSVKYPPRGAVSIENYMQKVQPTKGGLLSRKFIASDGQEYKWTLVHYGPDRSQWTCVTGRSDYFVAGYDYVDDMMNGGANRSLSLTDTWVHLAVELLTSLAIMRHISSKEFKFPIV